MCDPAAGTGGFLCNAYQYVLDHFGKEQRLAGDRPALACCPHSLEHQPLVRSMLVDDYEPVLSFGDDVGGRNLTARDPEGIVGDRFNGGFGARGGCMVEESAPLPDEGGARGG